MLKNEKFGFFISLVVLIIFLFLHLLVKLFNGYIELNIHK
jgi:hypothetical protein